LLSDRILVENSGIRPCCQEEIYAPRGCDHVIAGVARGGLRGKVPLYQVEIRA
jgi:hypothetical protein